MASMMDISPSGLISLKIVDRNRELLDYIDWQYDSIFFHLRIDGMQDSKTDASDGIVSFLR